MSKRIAWGSLVLVLSIGLIIVLVFLPFCFADDSITITTYYPSPYGSYNQLQTNRLAVGDTNNNGSLDSGDQPPADGQIYTARSVIFKPQASLAIIRTLPNPMLGELAYAQTEDKWYYNNTGNSSGWVAQGGGGGCYVEYSASCAAGFTYSGSAGWWGYCYNTPGGNIALHPPGGSCPSWWNTINQGMASICCKS